MTVHFAIALASDAADLGMRAYALVRGGRPERHGAGVNLSGWTAIIVVLLLAASAGGVGHIAVPLVDLSVSAAIFWPAVATARFWSIWAFGFALVKVSTGLATALLAGVPLLAYDAGPGIYADVAFGNLESGIWWHGFVARRRADVAEVTPCDARG